MKNINNSKTRRESTHFNKKKLLKLFSSSNSLHSKSLPKITFFIQADKINKKGLNFRTQKCFIIFLIFFKFFQKFLQNKTIIHIRIKDPLIQGSIKFSATIFKKRFNKSAKFLFLIKENNNLITKDQQKNNNKIFQLWLLKSIFFW